MGTSRRRNRRRSNLKKLPTVNTTLRELERKAGLPHLSWPRAKKGRKEPRGTRIRRYSLTPEERYMQYAPEGTAPERLLFGWLKRHNFMFEYQTPLMGGRVPGGAVVDFIIYDKYPPIIIRIMSYWHEAAAVQWNDQIQRNGLEALGYQVEDVWEREINTVERVDEKMRHIIYGAPKFTTGGAPAPRGWDYEKKVCPFCGTPECVYCES